MKLGIVVPYRNREQHLSQFVPHLSAYFARDKLDKEINYQVVIVEQANEKPFNRGALLNIGFLLLENEADYVCFHDIDYLPIWADYSPVDCPTVIVWYGAETRPIAPGRSKNVVTHNLAKFYGGVVLVDNENIRKVNGHPNDYWGWGYEDTDFQGRFDSIDVNWRRRKGTFLALDHDHEGFEIGGRPKPIAQVNRHLYSTRFIEKSAQPGPGLDEIRFKVLSRKPVVLPVGERPAKWEIVTVELLSNPLPEQAKATSQSRKS